MPTNNTGPTLRTVNQLGSKKHWIGVAGITDRPRPIKSGKRIKTKVIVQHRSDFLMQELIDSINSEQERLNQCLDELEAAKDYDVKESCDKRVKSIIQRCEDLLILLQIMKKINTELQFARFDLQRALKLNGDVNGARKRVTWLENRMERLVHQRRALPQHRPQPTRAGPAQASVIGKSTSVPGSMPATDAGYIADADSAVSPPVSFSAAGSAGDLMSRADGALSTVYSRGQESIASAEISDKEVKQQEAVRRLSIAASLRQEASRVQVDSSEDEVAGSEVRSKAGGRGSKAGTRSILLGERARTVGEDLRKRQQAIAMDNEARLGTSKSDQWDADEAMEAAGDELPDRDDIPEVPRRDLLPSSGYAPTTATREFSHYTETDVRTTLPPPTAQRSLKPEASEDSIIFSQHPEVLRESSSVASETVVETRDEVGGYDAASEGLPMSEAGSGSYSRTDRSADVYIHRPSTESEMLSEGAAAERLADEEMQILWGDHSSQQHSTPQPGQAPVFLTDGDDELLRVEQASRKSVSFRSPPDGFDRERYMRGSGGASEQVEEEKVDAVAEYWQSEHHRFDFSVYNEALLDNDPLSYHNLGLAVPGSFMDKEMNSAAELPWRKRSRGDIPDIHKRALDLLCERLRRMFYRIRDAGMTSVDYYQQSSQIQSFLDESTGPFDGSGLPTAGKTIDSPDEAQRRQDQFKKAIEMAKARLGTSQSGRLVYYPLPLTPPKKLPLTRTNYGRLYPAVASSFCQDDVRNRSPAHRLVEQRNLYDETKLKIYKGKAKAQVPTMSAILHEEWTERQKKHSVFKGEKTSIKKLFQLGKTAASFKLATKGKIRPPQWKDMKPKSGALQHSGLKWERVRNILHSTLRSERDIERVEAAKHLGLLQSGDNAVLFALKERLQTDKCDRVRYEAAKSLVLLGCWEEVVLEVVAQFLICGNFEMRLDLIKTVIKGKNIQFVDKRSGVFSELAKILSHFCRSPEPDDEVAFQSAVCLGKLCVIDQSARAKMKQTLEDVKDTHVKNEALDVLVRQLGCTETRVVDHCLDQIENSPNWKHRANAAKLIVYIDQRREGPRLAQAEGRAERLYSVIERRLWDEPIKEVRFEMAKCLGQLNLHSKAVDRAIKFLEDAEEDRRAQGVLSLATLGVKSDKTIRQLLEMLELDSSEFVRIVVIRAFGILCSTDKRIIRVLKEREKLEGPLARESAKALNVIRAKEGDEALE